MGRLSKTKIDRIEKLRKKGYLQKEVAQMVGVNIKTVRTYDPVRATFKSTEKPFEEPGGGMLPLRFYEDIRALADWVTILYLSRLDPDKIPCPDCLLPSPPSSKAKSKVVILKVLESGNYECPECGTTLTSPPNLSLSLSVTEVKEKLRREGRLPSQTEARS